MTNKEKNFVSAVIYVHNAERAIEPFLRQVLCVLEENFEHSEIICVNDASSDGSINVIKEVSKAAKSASISILNMSFYHGLELAMNAGVDLSIGDFVFEFDTTVLDFSGQEIMRVYEHALKGYDIVSASPDGGQRFSSKLFYGFFEKFSELSYKMYTENFRILSRRAINRISSMNKAVPYRKAVYANCGLKRDNIVYERENVIGGKDRRDRQEKNYRRNLAIDTLILFTQMGYRFAVWMTSTMIIITLVMAGYSVITYLVSSPVEGWTTTILFLSFAFFGLFGILTIVIKYLQIIVDLIFRRKRYTFEGIEKLTK